MKSILQLLVLVQLDQWNIFFCGSVEFRIQTKELSSSSLLQF